MAKITALTAQEKNKNRCSLFLDGEFFAGISVETILKYIDEDSESDIHTFKARLYPFGVKIDLNISLCNKVIKTSFLKEHLINFDGAIIF